MNWKTLKDFCLRLAGKSRALVARLIRRFVRPPIRQWRKRGFASPPPPEVKQAVLDRYSDSQCAWIETGTFYGNTTAFLASIGRTVHSIEPQPELAARARERFADNPNVTIIEALSEDCLDAVLSELTGSVRLWLDGHYSEGVTYKGPQDTPIRDELSIIDRHRERFSDIAIMIDDLRMFDPDWPNAEGYPTRSELVLWADQRNFWWTIEHDIFIASSRPLIVRS
jgi:hypothetical protein